MAIVSARDRPALLKNHASFDPRCAGTASFIEFNYQISVLDYRLTEAYCRLRWADTSGEHRRHGLIQKRKGEAFAMTSPLVTRSDGQKMGKSVGGAIWLDPAKTSPYEFYQYWLNIPDADTGKFLRLFTYLELKEIAELERLKDKEINRAKQRLALELTTIVHGAEEATKARDASRAVFEGQGSALEAVPSLPRRRTTWAEHSPPHSVRSGLAASTSEARRLISQGSPAQRAQMFIDYLVSMDDGARCGRRQELMLQAGRSVFSGSSWSRISLTAGFTWPPRRWRPPWLFGALCPGPGWSPPTTCSGPAGHARRGGPFCLKA
jgi:tyrosyl-tRNA synthetase